MILVDEIERLILLLDARLAEGKPIGREGAGPGEYVVPSSLFPWAVIARLFLIRQTAAYLYSHRKANPVGS